MNFCDIAPLSDSCPGTPFRPTPQTSAIFESSLGPKRLKPRFQRLYLKNIWKTWSEGVSCPFRRSADGSLACELFFGATPIDRKYPIRSRRGILSSHAANACREHSPGLKLHFCFPLAGPLGRVSTTVRLHFELSCGFSSSRECVLANSVRFAWRMSLPTAGHFASTARGREIGLHTLRMPRYVRICVKFLVAARSQNSVAAHCL